MENFKLPRDEIINTLNEIGINIPRHTKLKNDRLRHRLERCLDAAQRYANLFDDEAAIVDPSAYPVWNNEDSLVKGLNRKIWGGLDPGVGQSEGAFSKMCSLVIALGQQWEKGTREVLFTDQEASAIAIQVHSIHCVGEKRPLLVVSYSLIAGTRKMGLKRVIKASYAAANRPQPPTLYASSEEQALLSYLLGQNKRRFSPEFKKSTLADGYVASFLLPVSWLPMEDLGRLGKTTGCFVCGEPTKSQCDKCQSVQYCSKACQQKHWLDHQHVCRAISSGTWDTFTLEHFRFPNVETLKHATTVNRYDDLGDSSTIDDLTNKQVPPNLYGDKYYLIKLQMPVMGPTSHILVYDRRRSFKLVILPDKNPDTFDAAVKALGPWPKIYRWAQRVGDWDWKICFDQEPDTQPQW